MRKLFIFGIFAIIFAVSSNLPTRAQTIQTSSQKAEEATKSNCEEHQKNRQQFEKKLEVQ